MSDDQWTRLIEKMGTPDWATGPSLAHVTGRLKNQTFIDQRISEWTQSRIAEDLMTLLQSNGVPAGVVQTGEDLVDNDPQLASSNFIFEYANEHPTLGKISGDRLPLHFEGTLIGKYSRPEIFGESNRQILKDWLDMTDDDINSNIQSGLIR
jgi:crotonobetainyl-CoA:carnitine CoA-transferase CaiB-like acyl-CoA transferase